MDFENVMLFLKGCSWAFRCGLSWVGLNNFGEDSGTRLCFIDVDSFLSKQGSIRYSPTSFTP